MKFYILLTCGSTLIIFVINLIETIPRELINVVKFYFLLEEYFIAAKLN